MSDAPSDIAPIKRVVGRPFQKGAPGRPLGAKDKLARNFTKVLAADFKEHGKSAVKDCRENNPAAYLNVVAKHLTKEGDGSSGTVINILIAADEVDV